MDGARPVDGNRGHLWRHEGSSRGDDRVATASNDDTRFATSAAYPEGSIKTFSIWSSLEELIEFACDCWVVRELTPEEREQFGLPPADPFDN